jgi:hypothetical protein
MNVEKAGPDHLEYHEEERQTLSPEELTLLETTKVTEADAAQFPKELVLESPTETPKEIPPERQQELAPLLSKMNLPQKIRLALVGNQEARNMLIRDPNKVIPLAVLRNPKVSETEVISYAQLRTLADDVFTAIAKHKTWIKNYHIKLTLVSNPKAPLSLAIKLLDHLHDRDLQILSRSKGVSSVLARSAARLLFKRKG